MKPLKYIIFLSLLILLCCKKQDETLVNVKPIIPTIDSLIGEYDGYFRKTGNKSTYDFSTNQYINEQWDTTFVGSVSVRKSDSLTILIYNDYLYLGDKSSRSASNNSASLRNATTALFIPNDSLYYDKCTGCYAPALDRLVFRGKKR